MTPTKTTNRTKAEDPKADAPTEDAPEPKAETETETTETNGKPEAFDWSAVTEADLASFGPSMPRLYRETIKAEASLGQAHPVADLTEAIDALTKISTKYAPTTKPDDAPEDWEPTPAEGADRLAQVLDSHLADTIDAITNLTALSDLIRPAVETVDRSIGDRMVKSWQSIRDTEDMFSADQRVVGDALVTRWAASAPKAESGTRSRNLDPNRDKKWPDLDGFKVLMSCSCGAKPMSGGTDNINSERNKMIDHAKTHGALMGHGSMDYQDLTRSLVRVGLTPRSGDDKAYSTGIEQGSASEVLNVASRFKVQRVNT